MSAETYPDSPSPAALLESLEALYALLAEKLRQSPSAQVWISEEAAANLERLPDLADAFRRGASVPPPLARTPRDSAEASASSAPSQAGISPEPTEDKWTRLAAIRVRAENCARCRALGSLREKMVFAIGSPNARILFVGEAPGAEEERRGEPFVGPAGALLDKIIHAMGFQRSDVYISNIVKYRPMIDDGTRQGESNRKPTTEEMAASVDYVLEEIDVVDPEVIVALGGTAMEGLLGITGSVSSQRERFHDFRDRKVLVTYHPSYLLRNPAPGEKRKVWDDMKRVLAQLGLPVPDSGKSGR